MLSLLHVQIMIEAVFFAAILFLLWRLKKDIEKNRPLADGSVINQLTKIMADSQEFTNGFVMQMEKNKHALNKLACQLDEKEKRLVVLVDQAEAAIKQINSGWGNSAPVLSERRYDDVRNMLRQGMSREEASKQSGLTEGEIDLIMELSRTRTGPSS